MALRPDLAGKAGQAALSEDQVNNATERLRVAGAFLAWLGGRGRDLLGCRHADLDA